MYITLRFTQNYFIEKLIITKNEQSASVPNADRYFFKVPKKVN